MLKGWKKVVIIFIIGLIVTIFGLTLGILWSAIYTSILGSQLPLTPTSANYELWKETPIPMYLKLYMFNLTNPEAFNSPNGTKPHFAEMGPYVFREVDYKLQQTWNENNTITYQRKRVWHFDESLSAGKLSDNVTNINPVTASVAYTLRHKKPLLRDITDRIMHAIKQKLVITKTVNQLLFEGYNDTMLTIARKLKITKIPMDKFGWFYNRNNSATYDGTFNMLTGVSNMLELGMLKGWNYKDKVDYYRGECGIVKGTNGDLWPPLPDNKTISFFISDICTSMTVVYANTTIHEGLTGVTYTSDDTIFDNGTKVPWRQCYCEGECIPSGALNISLCKWGAPAFISLPHFYLADPSYRNNIDGMNPSKEKHQLSISIEPNTGVPLKVSAQLQLNLLIQPDKYMSMFKHLEKTFVPMLWFTQEAYLTPSYASKVKFVIILQSLGSVTFFGIAGIGILIICIGVFVLIRSNWKGEDNEVLLSRSSTAEFTNNDG
ncbi:protein croquemort-like [Colletes gigas]|uniref:protein croquemort-like n=1 Tax=Colletes gigas TaxID=935657 RepID=UPI001C9A97F4|nr:protein croquemort-like [Colletes gigas]XP_043253549.1 protein croquemort-like [Colletes gigas]XP_043253618.1 protein croquemort-like [Colletes gigas]